MSLFESLAFLLVLCGALIPLTQAAKETVTHEVTFDVHIGGAEQPDRTIRLGLFGKKAPRTVENFVYFAGEGYNGKRYEGSVFHRVIDQFMIQGGDVLNGDGTESISKFGSTFEDELPSHRHSVKGLLSMANAGRNTNGSQFFITTVLTPWLDGKHVVFGKVLDEDSMEVIHVIEKVKTDRSDVPIEPIKITKSTVVEIPEAAQEEVDIGPQ